MNFGDIPISDINYLLISNRLDLSDNKYLTAWNYLLTHKKY